MLDLYITLGGLYLFIVGGFFMKKKFKNKIDTKTLVLITIYFLKPILGFWGFVKAPINTNILISGILFFIILLIALIILFFIAKLFIKDKKIKIISTFTGTSGNTGNLGIPIAGILFGPIGIVIATMINFFCIFWNFTFGVFFYSRGKYSIKKSFLEIIKLPIIWASLLGLLLNSYGINFSDKIMNILDMGAYSSIVIQLFLLGIFISNIKIKLFDWKLNIYINMVKFLFLPFIGFLIIYLYKSYIGELNNIIYGVILLQLLTPLAINNSNLAHLYNCYENKVSESVLTTHIVFLLLFPIIFTLIK